MHKLTILLTGGGGAGTVEIIRTLQATGRYRIVAVDASPYAAGLALADRGYAVPLATDPTYQAVMERIVRDEQPVAVAPLVDEEILPLHAVVARLPEPRPRVLTPTAAFCAATLDKWQTFLALRAADIPTAPTWLGSQAPAAAYPAVIKPRDGRGSRDLAYVADARQAAARLACAARPANDYVIQERLDGQEYTVSVIVALGGPTLAVVPKEVLVKRGITQVGVTRQAPAIDRLCRDVQERLHADGPFNVQLMLRPDGAPVVFEINPRYSTTVALTIAAGIHEVDVVVRHALGEPVGALAFQPDLVMVRGTTHTYLPLAQWPTAPATAEAAVAGRVA